MAGFVCDAFAVETAPIESEIKKVCHIVQDSKKISELMHSEACYVRISIEFPVLRTANSFKSLLSDSTRRLIWLNLYFDIFNTIKLNWVSFWCVSTRRLCAAKFFVFWQITLDDDATEKARHVLKGNSFNKTLELGIKFFQQQKSDIDWRASGGWLKRSRKLISDCFCSVWQVHFQPNNAKQQKKKLSFMHFSCQYLISVQSQKQPGNSSRCHCLLFSYERIEFRTIDFTILWDECAREIFLWFLFSLGAILNDYFGPTTLWKGNEC